MAFKPNRAYNNPEIGNAMTNIASMFGPPDAGELVNYAQAAELRQKHGIIESLKSDPRYQGADAGVLAGLFNPTQSWQALEMDDATKRYGIDTTAATSRANNLETNRFNTLSDMYQPLNPGQIRPELPADVAGQFSLPAMPGTQGLPKPMSETEVKGSELLRLIDEGDITDQMQVDDYLGQNAPVKIVRNGVATFENPGAAIGEQAYVDTGSQPKPENKTALLRDGTQVPAIQGADGRWYHAQSKALLPDDIKIFNVPQAQGTSADIGLSKPTDTYIEKQLIDIGVAKDTAIKLREMIATAPASQGIVGWLRGTAQNVVQTGSELGQFFGGQVAEVAKDIEAGLADAELAGAFDPQIPAIEMMANLLAFQYAKTTTGERLSNEMLRAARAALGLEGLDANQANSLARLNQAIAQIESQEAILKRVMDQGVGAASSPAPAAPAAGGIPAGWSPEEWGVLTDEERQQVLNDQ